MSVFQVKLKLFILNFQERVHVLKIQMLFFIHTVFFVLPWMGVSGFVDSKSSNVFGGELNENILKLKKKDIGLTNVK